MIKSSILNDDEIALLTMCWDADEYGAVVPNSASVAGNLAAMGLIEVVFRNACSITSAGRAALAERSDQK